MPVNPGSIHWSDDEVDMANPVLAADEPDQPAELVRCERLGATGDQEGLYVRFDYGFGTNVHIGFRHRGEGWKSPCADHETMAMSIVGWERLCELVDEWRHSDGSSASIGLPGADPEDGAL